QCPQSFHGEILDMLQCTFQNYGIVLRNTVVDIKVWFNSSLQWRSKFTKCKRVSCIKSCSPFNRVIVCNEMILLSILEPVIQITNCFESASRNTGPCQSH